MAPPRLQVLAAAQQLGRIVREVELLRAVDRAAQRPHRDRRGLVGRDHALELEVELLERVVALLALLHLRERLVDRVLEPCTPRQLHLSG